MRIVYDARVIDRPSSGLGRFAGELLLALLDSGIRPDVRVDVLVPASADAVTNRYVRVLRSYVDKGHCALHPVSIPPISVMQQLAIPALVSKLGGDLYFYPHFDVPSAVPIPFIFVVHDLTPLKVAGYVHRLERLKKRYFKLCVERGLRKSLHCVAVSQTTKRDLLEEFGAEWEQKIHVSYEGSSISRTDVDPRAVEAMGIKGAYLLYVGTRRPNKNIKYMLDVFANMRQRFGYSGELVMAGSTRDFEFDVGRYAAAIGGVRILGPVKDDQLAALYDGTDSLVLLSKYEGFGLPVMEAAQFGRRMIVSDGGALPEIAPASACIVPLVLDPQQAAAVAVAYLQRTDTYTDLSHYSEQFSWHAVARAVFKEAY